MTEQKTVLTPGKYYHIYNRGINSCDIFHDNENYEYFLGLYHKHVSPVANTLAWVLMKNHFHFLVQILPEECWGVLPNPLNPEGFKNLQGVGGENLHGVEVDKRINQQFSNLFNAYTKAFNKRYHRTGSLFEHTFRRKEIDNLNYLKNVIIYIHQNPVKHGFCEHPSDYPWSSYLSCVTLKPTKLQRETVIGWFGNTNEFKRLHEGKLMIEDIERYLEL